VFAVVTSVVGTSSFSQLKKNKKLIINAKYFMIFWFLCNLFLAVYSSPLPVVLSL